MTDTAKISERLLQERADRLVQQNVLCCLSPLVATLAMGAHAVTQSTPMGANLAGLVEQAIDLAAPVDDYEEAARQEGWAYDEPADEWRLNDTGEGFDAFSRSANAEALCTEQGIDPCQREVFEHWAVSPWLAEKLRSQGEKVDTDFPIGPTAGGAPLAVWARTTSGQAIAMDPVIRGIVAALHTEG